MNTIYKKRYPIVAFLIWNLVLQSIATPLLSLDIKKPNSIVQNNSGSLSFDNLSPINKVQNSNYDWQKIEAREDEIMKEQSVNEQKQLDHGGPSTPEVQGFSATSTDEMVNLSTGDFSYTIPLLDVGGYPVSMQYNSQVSGHEDASCKD